MGRDLFEALDARLALNPCEDAASVDKCYDLNWRSSNRELHQIFIDC